MELIVGTNNQQKLLEMQQGLNDATIQLVSYQNYQTIPEKPKETGATYAENAYLKGRFYQEKLGRPVLGDDGGLELAAFPELLGLKTSRFFQSANSAEQNQELLDLFTNEDQDRRLVLTSTLVYVINQERQISSTATLAGELVAPRGTGGYGFDAIIYLPELGQTLAELTEAERNALSPRLRALRALVAKLKEEQDA